LKPTLQRWLKRIALVVALSLALLLVLAVAAVVWVNARLGGSLARLDGELALAGLGHPVTIERDDGGVPTIRAENRRDLALATGFLHAQERLFQMDLLRRRAAGELAEMIGPVAIDTDRHNRLHRFRAIAEANVAAHEAESLSLLEAYAAGVNAGIAALDAPPPEYLALRVEPRAWTPVDTTLVVQAMYLELQDDRGRAESDRGLMADLLPRELFEFLVPPGTEWDAPLSGSALDVPPIPAATVFDLRRGAPGEAARAMAEPPDALGSNGWAVAGSHTDDGGALLANDMHLPHLLPNIWYRASFVWRDDSGRKWRATGVTLPGAPPIIVGSNGHVAWGFTNSETDLSDLVVLEADPADPSAYLTPQGPRRLEHVEERIRVKGRADEILVIEESLWGPVVDRDHLGRRRALRWIAHDPSAVDLGLMRMELARDLDEALAVAAETRLPTQNCQVVDRNGRIGWTLMGPLPRRVGFDGRTPRSWADGRRRWDGYLAPVERPRIVDPPSGRIWTANNRIGSWPSTIGDGGFALGARAGQIRDALLALERADERDMLALQLDDRALFLERWRGLLLDLLTPAALAAEPRRIELRRLVAEDWSGRASVDSAGFRMVRTFRLLAAERAFSALTAACSAADRGFANRSSQFEGALWRLVRERPLHLLDPRYESWEAFLLAAADGVVERFAGEVGTLADRTWGERNTVAVGHPLSQALPLLSRWLDAAPRPLPGAEDMPRVQNARFGASMRMTVSPGQEDQGLFHMPGGQSGHPRSPYYLRGLEAWARGEPTPFLPGPPLHTLTLRP